MKTRYILPALVLLYLSACTYTRPISDGKTAFERRQYAVAVPMLEKEYKKAKENRQKAEQAYMLAESNRRLNKPKEAAQWYGKALEHQYGKDEALQQARMLQMLQDYDEAAKAYTRAGRQAGDVNLYRLQIQACKTAKTWLAEEKDNPHKIENLSFNTPDTDFSAIVHEDKEILFSSDRKESQGKALYKWTNEKFFDFYVFDLDSQKVKRWDSPFNGDYHQGTISFNKAGDEAYFTSCGSAQKTDNDYCRILHVKKEGGTWGQPKELWFCRNMNFNYMHPLVSEDGRYLFYAANNRSGFGGYDLYWSFWLKDENKWSEPKNLGSTVNTAGDEVFPYLDKDTLYFSSNGHPGMGGLDVYRVERVQDQWRKLQNLRAPMNSGGDDFGLVFEPRLPLPDSVLRQGYFTSNRPGGKGSDDIYRFELRLLPEPPKPDTPPAKVDTPQIVYRIRLEGLVKEKILVDKRKANSAIEGYAEVANVPIEVMAEDTAFVLGSDEKGVFFAELQAEQLYTFKVNKTGYFKQEASLSTKDLGLSPERTDTTLYIELILDRIYTNQEIVLENIYYDYNQFFIREDAKPPLDSLTNILKKNPELRIQLASHTDCRGNARYNQTLSQNRAQAAVNYLIQNGISAERLVAKGFGKDQPAVNCRCELCTEEEHQANRRTTFMVLSEDGG